jgi:hypothetical protein
MSVVTLSPEKSIFFTPLKIKETVPGAAGFMIFWVRTFTVYRYSVTIGKKNCPTHACVPYSAEFTVTYCTMYCTRFNAEY